MYNTLVHPLWLQVFIRSVFWELTVLACEKYRLFENVKKMILPIVWVYCLFVITFRSPKANEYGISVSVAANTSVIFNLTYQQLLSRRHGIIEHRISSTPGQVLTISAISHFTLLRGYFHNSIFISARHNSVDFKIFTWVYGLPNTLKE